jgi:hypothetical protein
MAASVILRWQVSDLECELQISGSVRKVAIRQHGRVVQSATVESAAAAQEWTNQQIAILERPQRRTG